MGNNQKRGSVFLQLKHMTDSLIYQFLIQAGSWLVGNDQRGPLHYCAGDEDTSRHAAGKFKGIHVSYFRSKAVAGQYFLHLFLGIAFPDQFPDLVAYGHKRIKVIDGLRDNNDLSLSKRPAYLVSKGCPFI